MRLEINAGGLDSFFHGVSSFISAGVSSANSNRIINSLQNVANKTNSVSGGVGTLGTALGYIRTRKTIEETRKTAVQAVKTKVDGFTQTAIRVDTAVAGLISCSQEAFYQTNPWLRPPVPPGLWDYVCAGAERLWNTAKEVWNRIVDFYEEHKKIIDTVLIAVGAVLAIAAVVCTGGWALAPMLATGLTALGVSAATAATVATVISLSVATIAVTSTLAASTLNLIDTWCEIDNPTFNTWQKGLNITSFVTNSLYSIGIIYNSIKGVSGKDFIKSQKPKGSLKIVEGGNYSASEIRAAEHMNNLGNDVILRPPTGSRVGGGTSDLLVNGVNYDVYTPITSNPSRIIGAIADKNSQTVGIVLDLAETSVRAGDLGNILARVEGIIKAGGKVCNIKDIVILP